MGMDTAVSSTGRTGRRVWLALACLFTALVAIVGWQVWRGWRVASIPAIPLNEAEPAVAQAVQAARAKIEREPRSAAAWGDLGKLLRAVDYLRPASDCFAQAARLEPDNPRWPYLQGEALVRQNAPGAIQPLQRALALSERSGGDILVPSLRLAETLLAAGDYDNARIHLQRALEIEPDHPSVHLDLGILALAQNDLSTARMHLLKCRESPFTQQKASTQLAVVCRRLGQTAEAEDFAKAAARLPSDVHWSDPYVMDCLRQGAVLGAVNAGFRLVEQLEKQGSYREAAMQLREMATGREDYRIYVALGKNLLHLGDGTEAARVLEKAIQLVPENVQAYYYLSRLRWAEGERERKLNKEAAAGKYRAAAAHARKVLRSNPDHAQAHLLLGRCLIRLGKRDEAYGQLQRAVACGPDNPDAWLELGEVAAAEGRTAEARRYLEQASRLAGANDVRVREALNRLAGQRKKS